MGDFNMKYKALIATPLVAVALLTGYSVSNTNTKAPEQVAAKTAKKPAPKPVNWRVSSLNKITKTWQYYKASDGTIFRQVASTPSQSLSTGPIKVSGLVGTILQVQHLGSKSYQDIVQFNDYMPLPDNFKFKKGMTFYILRLIPSSIQNTSSTEMLFGGLGSEGFVTPKGVQRDTYGNDVMDYADGYYKAHAKKTGAANGMYVYIGTSLVKGTYRMTMGDAINESSVDEVGPEKDYNITFK